MLHHSLLAKVLQQGLAPVSVRRFGKRPDCGEVQSASLALPLVASPQLELPVAVLLLSGSGLPLATVLDRTAQQQQHESLDEILRVYLLVGYNAIKQDDRAWTIMQVDQDLKLLIEKVTVAQDSSAKRDMYVAMFYHDEFPDHVAKLKVDNLVTALHAGFKGFLSVA